MIPTWWDRTQSRWTKVLFTQRKFNTLKTGLFTAQYPRCWIYFFSLKQVRLISNLTNVESSSSHCSTVFHVHINNCFPKDISLWHNCYSLKYLCWHFHAKFFIGLCFFQLEISCFSTPNLSAFFKLYPFS